MSELTISRSALAEMQPLLRRVAGLDPNTLVRVRADTHRVVALIWLPFQVLAARTVNADEPTTGAQERLDETYRCGELYDWLAAADGLQPGHPDPSQPNPGQPEPGQHLPTRCDQQWRWSIPPERGWRRVERIGEEVIRQLVATGARALRDAGSGTDAGSAINIEAIHLGGMTTGHSRNDVGEALLNSAVLHVRDEQTGRDIAVNLRVVSALKRMGFVPRDTHVVLDVNSAWLRLAGAYGSVYWRDSADVLLSLS